MSNDNEQQQMMGMFVLVIIGLCALFYFAPVFTRNLIGWVFYTGWTGRHPIFGW